MANKIFVNFVLNIKHGDFLPGALWLSPIMMLLLVKFYLNTLGRSFKKQAKCVFYLNCIHKISSELDCKQLNYYHTFNI